MAKKTAKKKPAAKKPPTKKAAKKPLAKKPAAKPAQKLGKTLGKKPASKPGKKPAKKLAAKSPVAKAATKALMKPTAKVAKKPIAKTVKKPAPTKRPKPPALEVEVTSTLRSGHTYNPDTTEAANFAESQSHSEFDASSALDQAPSIPPSRDDLLTTASASHVAALRQLRENDPTYAAGVVDAKTFATHAARLLHDDNCSDVIVLDVRGLRQDCDYIVIGSGTSDRQMRGVAKNVEDLGTKQGFSVYRKHADERATWILADFVHVVVHLFEPNTRATYDIEMMWADAPRIAWERDDQLTRNRAGLSA